MNQWKRLKEKTEKQLAYAESIERLEEIEKGFIAGLKETLKIMEEIEKRGSE